MQRSSQQGFRSVTALVGFHFKIRSSTKSRKKTTFSTPALLAHGRTIITQKKHKQSTSSRFLFQSQCYTLHAGNEFRQVYLSTRVIAIRSTFHYWRIPCVYFPHLSCFFFFNKKIKCLVKEYCPLN